MHSWGGSGGSNTLVMQKQRLKFQVEWNFLFCKKLERKRLFGIPHSGMRGLILYLNVCSTGWKQNTGGEDSSGK